MTRRQRNAAASGYLPSERAERLSGSFVLDKQVLPAVARICKLVDGNPLALELAAPWAIKMPLEAVAANIQDNLDFLSTSMTGIPERHRSMRAVFESSWRLLTPGEQRLLACCASFPGDFTVEQALAASQAPGSDLETLAGKFQIANGLPGRYKLHEILRQFALEKRNEML